jgi:peptidoglycan hydrolase-like protein with peptidoglycan-binding domain
VVVAGVSGRGGATGTTDAATTATTPIAGVSAVAAATNSVAGIAVNSDPAIVKSDLAQTIAKGAKSDDVTTVQQRLTDLGFAPGPIDGVFGSGTQQAVWAYEKLILKVPRAKATGKVTNEMWQGMQDRIVVPARRPTGAGTRHLEIYVPEQVAIVFTDDHPTLITHIATGLQNPDGSPKKWCETLKYDTGPNGEPLTEPLTRQECAEAKTPGGVFKFTHNFVGKRTGPLGGMMNPWYFDFGIAIHGADNIPLEPASHGCVRVNQTIAKALPTMFKKGEQVFVWAQDGREPEQYSKRDSLPSFNYADPSATTTTSTTTTIAKTTTTPAPTTVIKATTTIAAATTTTAAPTTTLAPVAPTSSSSP